MRQSCVCVCHGPKQLTAHLVKVYYLCQGFLQLGKKDCFPLIMNPALRRWQMSEYMYSCTCTTQSYNALISILWNERDVDLSFFSAWRILYYMLYIILFCKTSSNWVILYFGCVLVLERPGDVLIPLAGLYFIILQSINICRLQNGVTSSVSHGIYNQLCFWFLLKKTTCDKCVFKNTLFFFFFFVQYWWGWGYTV